MEYIYAAMLLHKAGKKIDEASVTKVLEAAGVKADPARAKALVAALDGVDIDKAVKESIAAPQPVQSAPAAEEKPKDSQPEKKQEDESKKEEEAAAGLGALFG